jgi:hypothetical protein
MASPSRSATSSPWLQGHLHLHPLLTQRLQKRRHRKRQRKMTLMWWDAVS